VEILIAYLNSIKVLSPDLDKLLRHILKTRVFKKKELVLRERQVCKYIYFIENGILRHFVNAKSKEITTWLLKNKDICISVKSFFEQIPATDNIEALKDTTVWYISFEELEDACRRFPEFAAIRDKIKNDYYIIKEEREPFLRSLTPLERYKYLLKTDPDLIQGVNIPELSSYLFMTPKMLSKIRKKLRDEK
jgi:CRP-like cAMP-binding protein